MEGIGLYLFHCSSEPYENFRLTFDRVIFGVKTWRGFLCFIRYYYLYAIVFNVLFSLFYATRRLSFTPRMSRLIDHIPHSGTVRVHK